MRIPEYYKQVEPSLAKIPASDAGAGIIRLPGGQSKAGEAISGSLANVSAAVAQRQAPMSGAEKLLDHAMRASALLGQFAEKQQKEIDDMDLYGFKAASDAELFNILNDIQTSGDYRDCRERGKDAWNKYGEEALKNLDNKRIAKRAEDYLKIKTIGVQADFQGVFIKRQQDYRNAKLIENEDQAIKNRQYIKLKQLIDSATNLSEEQKVVRWKNGQRRISLLNAEGDLKRLEADFEYSEEKYPGLAPEDVQAFNDKRDVFVENRFVDQKFEDYWKVHGMNYEKVYRLINADEGLKDDQKKRIWGLYNARYQTEDTFRKRREAAWFDSVRDGIWNAKTPEEAEKFIQATGAKGYRLAQFQGMAAQKLGKFTEKIEDWIAANRDVASGKIRNDQDLFTMYGGVLSDASMKSFIRGFDIEKDEDLKFVGVSPASLIKDMAGNCGLSPDSQEYYKFAQVANLEILEEKKKLKAKGQKLTPVDLYNLVKGLTKWHILKTGTWFDTNEREYSVRYREHEGAFWDPARGKYARFKMPYKPEDDE